MSLEDDFRKARAKNLEAGNVFVGMVDGALASGDLVIAKLSANTDEQSKEILTAIVGLQAVAKIFIVQLEAQVQADEETSKALVAMRRWKR